MWKRCGKVGKGVGFAGVLKCGKVGSGLWMDLGGGDGRNGV